jgi:hypothetical protein
MTTAVPAALQLPDLESMKFWVRLGSFFVKSLYINSIQRWPAGFFAFCTRFFPLTLSFLGCLFHSSRKLFFEPAPGIQRASARVAPSKMQSHRNWRR